MTDQPAVNPHLILAALDEALRPDQVTDRYERGTAWVAWSARQVLAGYALQGSDTERLATIDTALRAWLDEGPDYDSEDYDRGCIDGQTEIRQILDGDWVTIYEMLQDAHLRAKRAFLELATEREQA